MGSACRRNFQSDRSTRVAESNTVTLTHILSGSALTAARRYRCKIVRRRAYCLHGWLVGRMDPRLEPISPTGGHSHVDETSASIPNPYTQWLLNAGSDPQVSKTERFPASPVRATMQV